MHKIFKNIKVGRIFLLALVISGIVLTSVTFSKYVLDLGEVGNFLLDVEPTTTIPKASEFKSRITTAVNNAATEGKLIRLVFDRWTDSGYTNNSYGDVNIAVGEWNNGENVDYFGGIKIFVRSNRKANETDALTSTAYILSKDDIKAPSDCTNLFSGTNNSLFKQIQYIDFSENFHIPPGKLTLDSTFKDCTGLLELDLSPWAQYNEQITKITLSDTFSNCKNLQTLSFKGIDFSKTLSGEFEEHSLTGLNSLYTFDLSYTTWSGATIAYILQATNTSVLDVTGINTEATTSIGSIFMNWTNLYKIIGFEDFDTDNVTNIRRIFLQCSSLDDEYFQIFADVLKQGNKVNRCERAFQATKISATSANAILDALANSPITTMSEMFENCSNIKGNIDMSSFNASSLTAVDKMFLGCTGMTGIKLPATSNKITNYVQFLSGCTSLTSVDFSNFKIYTGNLVSMYGMFENCSSLTSLDLSNFNTSQVRNMRKMFSGCKNLKTIYVGNEWMLADRVKNEWTSSGGEASSNGSAGMFTECTKLVGGNGTVFDATKTNYEYARIDEGSDSEKPGYFTDINAFSNRIAYLHSEQFDAYYADLLERFESEYPTEYAEMMVEVNALLALEGMEISTDDGYPYLYGEFYLEDLWRIWKSHLEKVYTDILMPTPAGIYADRQKSSVEKVTFVKLSEFTSPAHSPFDLPLDDYGSGAVRLSLEEGWLISEPNTLYFVVNDLYFDTMIAPENMSGFFQGFTNLTEVHFNGLLDVSGVTDFSSMFAGCTKLQTIYVAAGEDWSTINATGNGMFDGCANLKGGNGTQYNDEQTGLTYARIDGGTEKPGYFTQK